MNIPFTSQFLSAIIKQDFPDLTITSTTILGNGWDNVALEINGTYIFRFPKQAEVPFEREVAILQMLQGRISLAIPQVEYLGTSARYLGYSKITGSDLTPEIHSNLTLTEQQGIAHQLAGFLYEIHICLSKAEIHQLQLPTVEPRKELDYATSLVNQELPERIRDCIIQTIHHYEMMIKNAQLQCVLFNDLHGENIAFDPVTKRINGIFDFSDLAIGDIHQDFRDFYLLGRDFLESVVREYETISSRRLSRENIITYSRINTLANWGQRADHREKALREIDRWLQE